MQSNSNVMTLQKVHEWIWLSLKGLSKVTDLRSISKDSFESLRQREEEKSEIKKKL